MEFDGTEFDHKHFKKEKNKMTTNKDAAKVELVNVTQDGLEILVYTKSGRLATGTTLQEIKSWNHNKKLEHLSYMMDTIKSSFEFVDYIFEIKNVSRAFTHQVVRTRTASFQQQAMRVVDARDFGYLKSTDHPSYTKAFEISLEEYGKMIDSGVPVQDARGVLGTGIHTSIFVKGNLRTLSNMAELRLCKRAEGEYQSVFKKMVAAVIEFHPWATPLLTVHCVKYGICAFPRYDKCPVQKYTWKMTPEYKNRIDNAWKKTQHVANPVANKAGMTM